MLRARRHSGGQREDGFAGPRSTASGDPGGRQHILVARVEHAAARHDRAGVGHQHDPMTAPDQCGSEGLGRIEMPARATGGDDDRTHFRASHGTRLRRRSGLPQRQPDSSHDAGACTLRSHHTASRRIIASGTRLSRVRSSRALARVSDSNIPMPRPTATAEEPPYEINGNVIPLVGIMPRVENKLTIVCKPKPAQQTRGGENDEQILLPHQSQQAAQHDEGEHADQQHADDQTELLANHGENDVGVHVGNAVLDHPLTRAATGQPAVGERLHHLADLIIAAVFAVQELIDPAVHMRQQRVEQHAAAAGEAKQQS